MKTRSVLKSDIGDLEICSKFNSHHYDTSAIHHQIAVWKPEGSIQEPLDGSTYQTGCALAHHHPMHKQCKPCVQELGNYGLITKRITDSSFLVSMNEKVNKARLASCIAQNIEPEEFVERCYRFQFLPREMCEYENKQGKKRGEKEKGMQWQGSSSNRISTLQKVMVVTWERLDR